MARSNQFHVANTAGLSSKDMQKKSQAASNLWDWVTNIYAYNRIYVKVKPLMERLEEARANKQKAMDKLKTVKGLLASGMLSKWLLWPTPQPSAPSL